MSTEPESDAALDQLRRDVLAEIKGFDERMGSKWSWGGNLKFLFNPCGLTKVEVDDDLKQDFQRDVHRLIPVGNYGRAQVKEHVDEIIGLVRHYHHQVIARAARSA